MNELQTVECSSYRITPSSLTSLRGLAIEGLGCLMTCILVKQTLVRRGTLDRCVPARPHPYTLEVNQNTPDHRLWSLDVCSLRIPEISGYE